MHWNKGETAGRFRNCYVLLINYSTPAKHPLLRTLTAGKGNAVTPSGNFVEALLSIYNLYREITVILLNTCALKLNTLSKRFYASNDSLIRTLGKRFGGIIENSTETFSLKIQVWITLSDSINGISKQ